MPGTGSAGLGLVRPLPGSALTSGFSVAPSASGYLTAGAVFRGGPLAATEVPNLANNSLPANLRTGRYASTDGSTGKLIDADCSALGSGNYYLTGKVRPTSVTVAEMTMDGSTDSGVTGLTADVWQEFTTATATGITPSAVILGWNGMFDYSAADWSDVRLVDADTETTVARWQLNESADGDLDGYPALDSSGNGFNGSNSGAVSGGTGEGIDPDVANIVGYDDRMYFDGVDDFIQTTSVSDLLDRVTITFFTPLEINSSSSPQGLWAWNDSGSATAIYLGGGTSMLTNETIWIGDGLKRSGVLNITIPSGINTITLEWNSGDSRYDILLNGVAQTVAAGSNGHVDSQQTVLVSNIGSATAGEVPITGFVESVTLHNSSYTKTNEWLNNGNTNADWEDQIGSNNGTVNGSPVTVGQKRATILQSAGQDWNKRMWFDGSDDYVNIGKFTTLGDATSDNPASFTARVFINATDRLLILGNVGDAVNGIAFGTTSSKYFFALYDGNGNNRIMFTSDANASENEFVWVTATYDGSSSESGIKIYVNGSEISGTQSLFGTYVAMDSDANDWLIGAARVGGYSPRYSNGIISDLFIHSKELSASEVSTLHSGGAVSSSLVSQYSGNDNTDSGWIDQIGSNDGTVNGSPSNYLIPESDTTAGEDALGNPLDPATTRINGEVINLIETDGSVYALLPDDPVLENVRSITMAIYNDGGTHDVLQDVNGNGLVKVASGTLESNEIFSTFYVNGLGGTALSSGWNIIGLTLLSGYDLSGSKIVATAGKLLAYDSTALSSDQHLKNYNALRAKYGI